MRSKFVLLQGLILSFILVLLSASTVYAGFSQASCRDLLTSLPENVVAEFNEWMRTESRQYVPPEHQKKLIWAGEAGHSTDVAVLGIHGLYNSPRSLTTLLPLFEQKKMNIMMTRMEGHFESSSGPMRYNIKWRTWLEQSERDFLLARKLGKKVLLVGHSTGGLLVTWLALRFPEDVAGLVLFSPAFGVHPLAQIGAWISDTLNFTIHKKNGQILYGHAGLEVIKAAKAYNRQVETNLKKDPRYIADRLSRIPVWMGNTHIDFVISQHRVQEFFNIISADNPENSKRESLWVPFSQLVLHDNITTDSNTSMPVFKISLQEFLSSLPHETDSKD